jgi:predicted nucleic acid-binding protein
VKEAVVDASVAAKWVVDEDHSDQAALLLELEACHAPNHWLAEAVNVLWSKVFKGDLTAADAEERATILLRAPVAGAPVPELMPRAFAISVACTVTIYDSLYLALAEKLGIPMVTADERLIARLSGNDALRRRLIWVGDLTA